MNILLVSYDFPPFTGGIANVSYEMARQLHGSGEKIIVVAQKTKGDREFDKNNEFLTYRCTNVFFLREVALILLLPFLVLTRKIDVIYILIWCQGGFATFLTSKLLNIPYVLHAHGLEFIDYKKTFFDKIKYSLFRQSYKDLIFKNAKKMITGSNYTKNFIVNSGVNGSKIEVIYYGVDIKRFRPGLEISALVTEANLKNKRILLTVSRLNEYKGHDSVIRLMPELLKKFPDLVYLIVGSGKDEAFLKSLVGNLDLVNNVIFKGYVDGLSLPLYYNICDVFIMLTKERLDRAEFEGFGLVYLEANSCEKPVIGSRTGGIGDAIDDGKTGYLVDPDNIKEVLDKLTLLLENRELAKRLGRQGRQRIISEGLTWEATGDKIRDILTGAINK